MKKITSRQLPSELLTFSSGSADLQALIEQRMLTIARCSGEPTASTHVAMIKRIFDLSSLEALKNSVIRVRDVARCAADILVQIPLLKTNRQVMDISAIVKYVQDNSEVLGYKLSAADQELAASLIAQSAVPEYSWTLVWDEEGDMMLPKIDRLYQSLLSEKYTPFIYKANDPRVTSFSRFSKNAMSQMQSAFNLLSDNGKESSAAISRAEAYLKFADKYADIIFLDHITSLLMDTDIWSKFIPDRNADSPSENVDRLTSLAAFAGYLHSLLIIPYFTEFHLFKASYSVMESWLSDFPAVPETVPANLDKLVRQYDTLGIEQICNDYVQSRKDNSNIHSSAITVLLEETVELFGFSESLREAQTIADKIALTAAPISDLQILRGSDYSQILLSLSLSNANLRSSVISAVYSKKLMEVFATTYCSVIASVTSRFLPPKVLDTVNSLNLRTSNPTTAFVPVVPKVTNSYQPTITDSSNFSPVGMPATSAQEAILREKFYLTILSAKGLIRTKVEPILYDVKVADELAKHLSVNYSTLIPSCMGIAPVSVESASLHQKSTAEMDDILEVMSGEKSEMISRMFVSPNVRALWATVLSSWGLLLMEVDADHDNAIKIVVKDKNGPRETKVVLVEGYGQPWGTSYSSLLNLNLDKAPEAKPVKIFASSDSIPSGMGLYYILGLSYVPKPSRTLDPTTFIYDVPYYTRVANIDDAVEVTHFVWGKALANFATRPTICRPSFPPVLYDRMHCFLNDTLFLQDSVLEILPTGAAEGLAITDKKRSWSGQKYQPWIEYVVPGGYISTSPSGGPGPEGETKEIMNMMEKMENATRESIENAPESHPNPPTDLIGGNQIGENTKIEDEAVPRNRPNKK